MPSIDNSKTVTVKNNKHCKYCKTNYRIIELIVRFPVKHLELN